PLTHASSLTAAHPAARLEIPRHSSTRMDLRMETRKKIAPLIAAVLAASTGAIADTAAGPTYEQLRQQIAELQARLDQIESTRVNAADTDRIVAEVLADAQRRSQLLALEGLTAGYDRGFFIRSEDGSFQLKPSLTVQFRY